jgi:hypothetical protein
MKSVHDIQLLSGIEILFNYSTKLSPSGCMCVLRQFDGMFDNLRVFYFFDYTKKKILPLF